MAAKALRLFPSEDIVNHLSQVLHDIALVDNCIYMDKIIMQRRQTKVT